MSTLYRKYRPQNFKEVVGQNHIKITLEHEIETGQLTHAYLFCGPRAVGKTTVARVLAKAINCEKRTDKKHEPCNRCAICGEITGGRSLDVIEIDAASHTGVDNVRDNIIANARVAPSRCRYKVFIIDEVHMLSISAFNALLKVIEEPPAPVIFILATTEVHKVPTTIISRCQRFDFKRISVEEIVKKLAFIANKEGVIIDKKILAAIARYAEGHMRDAESLLGQVVAIGGKEVTAEEAGLVIPRSNLSACLSLLDNLGKKDAASAINLINKLLDEGVSLPRFLTDVIEILRKIMLSKISPSLAEKLSMELGEDLEKRVSQVSADFTLGQIISYLNRLIEAKNNLKGSFIAQLPLEIAIAEICAVSVMPSYKNSSLAGSNLKPGPLNKAPAPLPAATSNIVGNNTAINKEMIISKWHEVLAKVKKYNHSLSFILRVCQPKDINGHQLCLAFRYKFHKDRINEASINELIEKVLKEVYGLPLTIIAEIDESIAPVSNNIVTTPATRQAAAGEPDMIKKTASREIDIKAKDSQSQDDCMVDDLIKTFGGKVVK